MFALFITYPLVKALSFMGALSACPKPTFFGLVPWYQYMTLIRDTNTGQCSIANFNPGSTAGTQNVLDLHSPFLLIGLAVLDDLIRVAALIAVGFTIYGGITYATSEGSPDATGKAKSTIINAMIGLVIALFAVAIVNFLGNKLGGNPVG